MHLECRRRLGVSSVLLAGAAAPLQASGAVVDSRVSAVAALGGPVSSHDVNGDLSAYHKNLHDLFGDPLFELFCSSFHDAYGDSSSYSDFLGDLGSHGDALHNTHGDHTAAGNYLQELLGDPLLKSSIGFGAFSNLSRGLFGNPVHETCGHPGAFFNALHDAFSDDSSRRRRDRGEADRRGASRASFLR